MLTESLQSVRESDHRQNGEQCGKQHCKIIQRTLFFNETYKELKETRLRGESQEETKRSQAELEASGELRKEGCQ